MQRVDLPVCSNSRVESILPQVFNIGHDQAGVDVNRQAEQMDTKFA